MPHRVFTLIPEGSSHHAGYFSSSSRGSLIFLIESKSAHGRFLILLFPSFCVVDPLRNSVLLFAMVSFSIFAFKLYSKIKSDLYATIITAESAGHSF